MSGESQWATHLRRQKKLRSDGPRRLLTEQGGASAVTWQGVKWGPGWSGTSPGYLLGSATDRKTGSSPTFRKALQTVLMVHVLADIHLLTVKFNRQLGVHFRSLSPLGELPRGRFAAHRGTGVLVACLIAKTKNPMKEARRRKGHTVLQSLWQGVRGAGAWGAHDCVSN